MTNGNGQPTPPPASSATTTTIKPTDLRGILQYVPRFHGQIFIIAIDGAIVADENINNLLVDIAVLRSLGIKVVIVHGVGHQIQELSVARKIPITNSDGTGVTDAATLDLDGEIIGKPGSDSEARDILSRLSGRSHRVLTAIAVTDQTQLEHRLSISEVSFRTLDADEIRRYVLSGEATDKAGAYAIQGRAAAFIKDIRGSHSGIVGLPLCDTALLLKQFGIVV